MRTKQIALFAVTLLLFTAGCRVKNGWVDLFNGRDLEGWKVLNGTAGYRIDDGTIVGVSKINTPNTFLVSEKEYGDFILEYEAKIDNSLNSGVQIRSRSLAEYNNGRVHGYQVELDPSDRAWTGGLYDEARRGWLYNLEGNPAARTAFKKGEFNRFRVEAIGSSIRVWLNGVPAVDLVDDMTLKGFIGLQVHGIGKRTENAGKTVEFRNLRIKTENLEGEISPADETIAQISYLNNRLSERETREGWTLLWDGKTSAGWRGARLDHFPETGWRIEDGVLTVLSSDGAEAANGGDIVTEDQYGDFILELDFRMSRGANSGIKYFVDCDLNKGPGSAIGCEFQILDDSLHPDAAMGVNGNRTLGSLYDLITADARMYAPNEPTAKRVNRSGWNRARIVVRGSHVEHHLNGIKILEYERFTHMWRSLVAYSKYRNWPKFGELARGNILLQDHGNEVSFKNIKIKILEEPNQ